MREKIENFSTRFAEGARVCVCVRYLSSLNERNDNNAVGKRNYIFACV